MPVCPASAFAMAVMFVVPVAPYAHATPNRKNADENAPSRKYFIAASFESAAARDPGQHVERERQDLQRQEHQDEVGRGRDRASCRPWRTGRADRTRPRNASPDRPK